MRLQWGFLKRALAGATFGLYMAHLLYYLNPQIDITPARLAVVTVVYGVICGAIFGTVLWLLRLVRIRVMGRADTDAHRRHGFGFIVTAAFVSGAVYWMHLALFRIYLPVGAVRILSKAANVIAVAAFSLFILWLVERSSRQNVSRTIFFLGCLLIAISSFFLYQRRDRYRTDSKEVVVADVGTVAGRRPMIIIAIRDVPYDWIITLKGEGLLPWFDQTSEQFFATRVEPFRATSPKALWASLATGQLPHRHGVTGRFSYQTLLNRPNEPFLLIPSAVGFQAWGLIPPVKRISAQLPAGESIPFWTIFERLGFRTAVINWPSTLTAEPFVTRLERARKTERIAAVHPPSLVARARLVLSSRDTALPSSAMDRALSGKSSDDLDVTRVAVDIIQGGSPDLVVISFAPLGQIRNGLLGGNTLPPRTSDAGQSVRLQLQRLDSFLGRITSTAPSAIIVVTSVSGSRPPPIPNNPSALVETLLESQDPGKDDGFLLIRGPGIVSQKNPTAARVVDMVPTTLFAAGLPVARDMDGRVITEAFSEEFLRQSALSIVQSYEAERLLVRRAPGR